MKLMTEGFWFHKITGDQRNALIADIISGSDVVYKYTGGSPDLPGIRIKVDEAINRHNQADDEMSAVEVDLQHLRELSLGEKAFIGDGKVDEARVNAIKRADSCRERNEATNLALVENLRAEHTPVK